MQVEGIRDEHLDIIIPHQTIDYFGGDYGRAKVYIDRYALKDREGNLLETIWSQTAQRVASAVANVETDLDKKRHWEDEFFTNIVNYDLMPAGRILYGAGSGKAITLFNCFLLPIEDSRESIYGTMVRATEILAKGGGTGFNFSNIRPRGEYVHGTGGRAGGPVSFITSYNEVFKGISQGGTRGAACMGMLSDSHPDIMEFVRYKYDNIKTKGWNHFNVSVTITNEFIDQVRTDGLWDLKFGGRVYKTIRARELWQLICEYAWKSGDPGLFHIDRVNDENPGNYFEKIIGSNPCAEQPLPANGICNLAAVNLGNFVSDGVFNYERFSDVVRTGIRFLDNILDIPGSFPFPEIEEVSRGNRRIGLGTMGIADALIKMRIRFGSEDCFEFTERIMSHMAQIAYDESINLAIERGAFPKCDPEKHSRAKFVRRICTPEQIAKIAKYGIRHVCSLTLQPSGTIAYIAGANSGGEPVFAMEYTNTNNTGTVTIRYKLYQEWLEKNPNKAIPDWFVDAHDVTPDQHVRMQALQQRFLDSAASKTINLPNHATVDDVGRAFWSIAETAKTITVFRDGCRDMVLERVHSKEEEQLSEQVGNREDIHENGNGKHVPVVHNKPITPRVLSGRRYRIKFQDSSYYINLTNYEGPDGKVYPYECFITNLNGSNFQWLAALSVVITAHLKSHAMLGLSIVHILDDLAKIESPQGGAWYKPEGQDHAIFLSSIPAAIALVIREHQDMIQTRESFQLVAEEEKQTAVAEASIEQEIANPAGTQLCPQCGHQTYKRVGNCYSCFNAGCIYSTCS